MQKKIVLTIFTLTMSSLLFAGSPTKKDYPHWNFNNSCTYSKLVRINNYIQKNKNTHKLAVFDWDGTLYNEHLSVQEYDGTWAGQPAFYLWGANHKNDLGFKLFPMFHTNNFKIDVINKTKYLEGRTNINPDMYSKFTQTACFTEGMTPSELVNATKLYLNEYKTADNVFLPMLDVLQTMLNKGFDVWIVTGSNQYFVSELLEDISAKVNYGHRSYNFSNICTVPYNSKSGHIAGNGLKLLKNGNFSNAYDIYYVKNRKKELYIVDHQGKVVAINNIEAKDHTTLGFVAGNSDGDYEDSDMALSISGSLVIGVCPKDDSKLKALLEESKNQSIILNEEDIGRNYYL